MFTNIILIILAFPRVFGELMEDFSVENFTLLKVARLKPDPIEQNLAFQVGDQLYRFVLMPRYDLITAGTNISFVSLDHDARGQVKSASTENINASNYAKWKFEGSSVANRSHVIRGFVDKRGNFEGYFIQNGDIYVLEPYENYQHSHPNSNDYNSVLFKMSDICHRSHSKINRTAFSGENIPTVSYKNVENVSFRICQKNVEVLERKKDVLLDPEIVGEMAAAQMSPNLFRRASVSPNVTYLCNLKVVLDHRFYKFVGKSDRNRSVNIVVSLLSRVDRRFRKVDFNSDGVADNIGFYIEQLTIYKDPVKSSYNMTSSWDAVNFFQEFREYDFSEACAGLLFTFREMQTAEENGPSLIKTQLASETQGICSLLPLTVPKASANDYGEFIANALPVNFRVGGYPASESQMVVQVMHQLGHLFGAPNDDFYADDEVCCKNMKGHTYVMAWPIPSGDEEEHHTYSSCSIMAMSNYLSKSSRPCLRTCEGVQCDRPLLGIRPIPRFVGRNVTSTVHPGGPTRTRDWTEYCYTVPRAKSSLNHLINQLLMAFLVFIVKFC